ncbi:hypothetical protein PTSG_06292 [Salpingoeca rosetta]|uniref:FAD-binding domain-containing protein n=1 Tax=Salpingoeca rosetta (strain ATCC 50818 / BSB-021) TaxID=946362 RepID=F2UCH6_SALR5|nr:uncharacterized protein PTSG_06292 [Salpingoeca rosetta]EGD74283.1 hypothetical protein PTSG_06292 [Salpingoeca rosetta]|eukprot:XP_004993183.1 hypothetical protein PTSG_06292 [Salpingoeca rosetta]
MVMMWEHARSFLLGALAVVLLQKAVYILSPQIGQPDVPIRRSRDEDGSDDPSTYSVIIVGAGAAGLSLAGRLERAGISYVVFEKDEPGSAWENRYDRLHLHTVRGISELPYWRFPDWTPTFVSRSFLAKYYRAYAAFHNVKTHTEEYTSGKEFEGKRVLVVGFGNSGSEMALDLWEWGAQPTVLVRSPIHMLPRSLTRVFGHMYDVMRPLPPWVHDSGRDLIYSLVWGDLTPYNISLKKTGFVTDIVVHHKAPVQDIGTMALIKKGEIAVIKHEIDHIDGNTVHFADGSTGTFDHILLATGFKHNTGPYSRFLPSDVVAQLPNEHNVVSSGQEVPHQKRLYMLGFNDYMGRLAEINRESAHIVKDIVAKKYV